MMGSKKQNKGAGHRQRLRDKFLESGLEGFHDYEVIELLLTIGTPRKDTKETAKNCLKRFKTLQGVLEASPKSLCKVEGIGPKNLFGIKLIKAVADRYLQKKLISQNPVNNSKELFDYLYHTMRDRNRESFNVIYLNAKNRVINSQVLFSGTLTASSVYPREVVACALENNAAALIFAHNHPSGDPEPSPEDIAITKKLVFACKTMGITVHDHLIIGNNKFFSFADEGFIAKMNSVYDQQNKYI